MPSILFSNPSATQPISLDEAKKHLRVTHVAEDDLIEALIETARAWADEKLGFPVMETTVTEYMDGWPSCCTLELAHRPNAATDPAVTVKIEHIVASATDYSELAQAKFTTDEKSDPARVVLKKAETWPALEPVPNCVKVTYKTGAATADSVPRNVRQAMLLQIGFLYENREDISINETRNPRIRSAENLLRGTRKIAI